MTDLNRWVELANLLGCVAGLVVGVLAWMVTRDPFHEVPQPAPRTGRPLLPAPGRRPLAAVRCRGPVT